MIKTEIMPKFVVDMKKIEPSKISEKKIFDRDRSKAPNPNKKNSKGVSFDQPPKPKPKPKPKSIKSERK